MTTDIDRFIVLTGGPGSGKSTLIEALADAGYARSCEAGRGIIQDQMTVGGPALPWNDPVLFAETMLVWEMRNYRMAQQERGLVFFDRGVPDVIGYMRLTGLPVPPHVAKAAGTFRYYRRVFIAPPWPEIFSQDAERRQDFTEAVRTHDAVAAAYRELGYELIELPRASVTARVSFVLDSVRAARR
jgi:predicted ATPase